MKKIKTFLVITPMLVFFISCQKERIAPSSFSAPGFWSGSFAGGPLVIDILNRPNGTARVYLRVTTDTASSANKLDGTFTVTGDNYEAHTRDATFTMKIQSLHTTTTSIEGIVLMTTIEDNHLVSYHFEVARQ